MKLNSKSSSSEKENNNSLDIEETGPSSILLGKKKTSLDYYCEINPEAPECRMYDI